MLALKAKYEKGRIQLVEPMPDDIKQADLTVVVMSSDKKGSNGIPANTYHIRTRNSEDEFKQIGVAAFFDTDDDTRTEEEATEDNEKLLENNAEEKQGIAEETKNREDAFLVFASNNEKIRIYFDFREKGSTMLNNLLDLNIDLQQAN